MPKPLEGEGSVPPNRDVAVVAYDGLCTFEFGIAVELFGLPRPEFAEWSRLRICAAEPGPLRAVGGFAVTPRADLPTCTTPAPWWCPAGATPPSGRPRPCSTACGARTPTARGWSRSARACSRWRRPGCSRAGALHALAPCRTAGGGLSRDPRRAGLLYVDEGQILTSAGSAAGIDLGLHLIRRDFGTAVANRVARRLVIPPHRGGGQPQFIDAPVQPEGAALAGLFDVIRANLCENLTVAGLAARAHMSERTLLRRFAAATGSTPGDWVVAARLARARELLEGSDLAVERIATASGFGTADTLRHHFRRRFGTSPQRYRDRFAVQAARS